MENETELILECSLKLVLKCEMSDVNKHCKTGKHIQVSTMCTYTAKLKRGKENQRVKFKVVEIEGHIDGDAKGSYSFHRNVEEKGKETSLMSTIADRS